MNLGCLKIFRFFYFPLVSKRWPWHNHDPAISANSEIERSWPSLRLRAENRRWLEEEATLESVEIVASIFFWDIKSELFFFKQNSFLNPQYGLST